MCFSIQEDLPPGLLTVDNHHTLFFVVVVVFLGHMEIPRLGVESELQPPAYTTAIATWHLSLLCDLYHSSWQHWILNPLSQARDRTRVLTDTHQDHNLLRHSGNSLFHTVSKTFHHFAYSLHIILEFPLWHNRNESNKEP